MKEIVPGLRIKDNLRELKKCDVLCIIREQHKGELKDGKLYAKLTDTLAEIYLKRGLSVGHVLKPYTRAEKANLYGNPVSFNRNWFFFRRMDIVISLILHVLSFGTKAKGQFYFFRNLVQNRILNKANPRLIFTIMGQTELFMAARKKNIPCVEVLHGIGYPAIPWGYDRLQENQLPTHILSFDDVSTKAFRKGLENKDVKVLQARHIWYQRFSDPSFPAPLPVEWKFNLDRSHYIKVILVSLQWGYDKADVSKRQFQNILENGVIAESLLSAIRKTEDQILWLIRLHPIQLRLPKYRHHITLVDEIANQCKNVMWKEISKKPLPAVLSQCDGNITMISMSAYDAAFMGVPTLLLCPTLRDTHKSYFRDLLETNYANLGDHRDTSGIINWVRNTKKRNKPFSNAVTDSAEDVLNREFKI